MSRALEYDEAGRLVWSTVIVSTARQQGKSWIERIGCGWRMSSADLFGGDEQGILHVAHKLTAAQEVWRPAARFYSGLSRDEASVRWANGEQQIELLATGSRWMIQAATPGAGVAFALNMALIDEGWRVRREVYEEGIEPTLAEAESPQTWLVSTAGTSESDLMHTYRAAAIATLDDPTDILLIEFSAPPDPDLDIDDPRVWRACSAHWDSKRELWMARKRTNASERAFRQQALNQWVPPETPPPLGLEVWPRVVTTAAPGGRLAFGGEVNEDHSRGVIIAVGNGTAEFIQEVRPAANMAKVLVALATRHNGVVGILGAGPADGAADQLRRALGPKLVRLTASQEAAAAGQVKDALDGDPPGLRLRDHEALEGALGARRRRIGASWAWERDGPGLVMGAISAAVWADAHAPRDDPEAEEPMVYS
jgi:hypothetical protein